MVSTSATSASASSRIDSTPSKTPPEDGVSGLVQNWQSDLTSGLLISLIALPLCLGIAMASGFPAFAGLLTAIIGGLIVAPLAGSQLTIKGPAAGLIAIAIGSVEALGMGDNGAGYKYTLAVIVVASLMQVAFALAKLGRFGDFFPSSAVHGMLAAIGIIIFSKQIHRVLGVTPIAKEPLELLAEIPHSLVEMNPDVAFVGVISALIVVLTPILLGRLSRYVPGPLLAVLVAVGLSIFFDFSHPHHYLWYNRDYTLEDKYLVTIDSHFLSGLTFPDFGKVFSPTSIQFIVMFCLIGSIESLLTVKAVDSLDPYKRKANLNRDLLAIGIGNTLCGLLGGLPMISEVVRSYSNISYGAKTRWSNFFHGGFLLLYVLFLAPLIHLVPLSALAGVLCVIGYRLASPKHFHECREIGKEQLIVFCSTILATLMTDLLVGIAAGIVVHYLCLLVMGAPLKSLFRGIAPAVHGDQGEIVINLPQTCFYGNVMGFKRELAKAEGKALTINFSECAIVEHTFMREIREHERHARETAQSLTIIGLDRLIGLTHHEASTRVAPGDTVTTPKFIFN